MEEADILLSDNQQNTKIKEYIKKFNNPEKFIAKILNSLPYSFSIVDVQTMDSELTNNKNYEIPNRNSLIKDMNRIKKPTKKEHSYKNSNGKERSLEIHTYPIFDNNGEVVKIIEYCIDITKKKEIEKKLKKDLNEINKEKILLEKDIDRYKNIPTKFSKPEKTNFTPKEKLVLYGLCKYPQLRDEELSKKLKIKRSTITSIKNRLKNQKAFTIIYLPNFAMFGGSILSTINCKFNGPIKERKELIAKIKDIPEIILNLETDKESLNLFISKLYIDLQKFQNKFTNGNSKILRQDIKNLTFFQELDKIKIFNLANLIDNKFELEKSNLAENIFPEKNNLKKLNNNEKRIIHSLIQFPEDTIAKISKKIWISKPTISKIKNRLIEEKVIIPFIFPNLNKLNFKIIAIVNQKDKKIKNHFLEPRTIAKIENDKKLIKVLLFKDQEEYEELIQLNDNYQPEIVFPINLILSKKLDFHSLTEKLIFD
jgi:DNA-binding MarR family transcriptional regulator